MKRLGLLLICLALLLTGVAVGLYVGWREGARTMDWLGAVSQGYVISELAYTQYQNGNYDAARQGLEGHLAYLEQVLPRGATWEEGHSPYLGESSLAADRALTLARLALLEEREHGPQAGDALWERAEEQATLAGWKDSSRRNIRSFVERLDRSLDDNGVPYDD